MIGEGFELMLVGMGVVFSFLILMVMLMRVSGAVLSRLPEPEEVKPPVTRPGRGSSAEAAAKLAVAIAAAHRERNSG